MPRRRLALAALVSTLAAIAASAFASCTTSEGERCNPSLSHDECASNLTCTVPAGCGYAVCCPKEAPDRAAACAPCAIDGGEEGSASAEGGPDASDATPADATPDDATEGG